MTTTRVLVILSLTTTPSLVLMSATSPVSYAPARRSRRMVLARARSRLACCTRDGFLATPMESWKRRLNSSSVSSRTFCSNSSPFMSRHADAFIVFWGGATAAPPPAPPTGLRRSKGECRSSQFLRGATAAPPPAPPPGRRRSKGECRSSQFLQGATAAPPPDPGLRRSKGVRSCPWLLERAGTGHELGLDADLLSGEAEALARRRLVHAFHLVHDSARLHHGDPELRVALALADPDLHADGSIGGVGLGEAIVDIGADGVERHASVAIPFAPRDFRAAQAAGAGDPDAVGPQAEGGGDRLLHGAAEGHPLLELQGHVLGHQLRVELGMDHLLDVEVDLLGRACLDLVLELLHLRALAADDDAGPRGEDGDAGAVGRALDVDA